MATPPLHARYILHQNPISLTEVKAGDVIKFSYDGEDRWALILNPKYEDKLHALVINELTQKKLQLVESKMAGTPPKLFYEVQVAHDPIIHKADAYRTYDREKIKSVHRVTYDFGFNRENPDTAMFYGSSIILGYDSIHVYADAHTGLDGLIFDRAKRGLYVSHAPLPPQVISFVRRIGIAPNFHSWKPSPTLNESEEQVLRSRLAYGGVFFGTDDELQELRRFIGVIRD